MNDTGVLHTRSKTYGKMPAVLMHDLTITDGAKVTYTHMHWRYSQRGQNFESQESMAKFLGVSEAAIAKRVKELEAKDWLIVIERGKDPVTKKHRTPIYHLFEHQGQCRQFRARYTCLEGETVRAKDESTPERKSRKGAGRKGGNPLIQPNSSLGGIHPNSSLHGNQPNSSLAYVLSSSLPGISTNTTTTPYETIKNKWQSVVRGGMPTPNDLVGIQEDMKLYSHTWIMDALNSVVVGRPNTWGYIQSILKTWKQNGKPGEAPRVKYITQVSTPHEDQRLALLMGQEYVPPVLQ